MFSVEACSGRSAFQMILESPKNLKLKQLCEKLKDYEVVACTSYLIVVKKNDLQLSLYNTGKLLVQNTKNEAEAKDAARSLYSTLGIE